MNYSLMKCGAILKKTEEQETIVCLNKDTFVEDLWLWKRIRLEKQAVLCFIQGKEFCQKAYDYSESKK